MKDSMNVGLLVCCGMHESEQADFNNCSLLCSTVFFPQCSVPGLGNSGQCSHLQVGEWARDSCLSKPYSQANYFLSTKLNSLSLRE